MSRSIANIEVDEDKFNATNETPNLHLPQFIATDKPGWLTDFNGAMEVLDEAAEVLQEQITEDFEDNVSIHKQLDRVDDEINNPESGLRQVTADTQNRVSDLEQKVGDNTHGLVKDVADIQQDLIQHNTIVMKDNSALGSVINLLCNKFVTTAQYSVGAYVYTENEDGSLNFLRCTETHRGVFNPDHFEDVTEKLISALDNSGGGGGSQYVLPIAGDADDPDALLGGVIVGEGLTIDPETGVLSRTTTPTEGIGPDYYALQTRAGLVKPGDALSVGANGILNVVVDDATIKIENGHLVAQPDTSRFAAGGGISIANSTISSKVDNTTIVVNGNGELSAVFPASSYDLQAGLGVQIDTDEVELEKTIATKEANFAQHGSVRPMANHFFFEDVPEGDPEYDAEHNRKKMGIQLKQSGGLGVDSNGLFVKIGSGLSQGSDGTINVTGGGGGSYTAGEGIDITNDVISADVVEKNGLSVDSSGIQMALANRGSAGTISRLQSANDVLSEISNGVVDINDLRPLVELARGLAIQIPSSFKSFTGASHTSRGDTSGVVNPGDWVFQVAPKLGEMSTLKLIYQQPHSLSEIGIVCSRCHTQFNLSAMFSGESPNPSFVMADYLETDFNDSSLGVLRLDEYIGEIMNAKGEYANAHQTDWQSDIYNSYSLPFSELLIRAQEGTNPLQPIATGNFNKGASTGDVPVDSIELPDSAKKHPLCFFYPLWITPVSDAALDIWGYNKRTFNRCITNITYHVYLCKKNELDNEMIPCLEVDTKTFSVAPGRWTIRVDDQSEVAPGYSLSGWGKTDDGSILVQGTHYMMIKEPIYIGNPLLPEDTSGNYFEYGSCLIYPNNFDGVRVIATIEVVEADNQQATGFIQRYGTVSRAAGGGSTAGGTFALYGKAKLYDLNAQGNVGY